MEALEAQFKTKIDITKECLEFCRGDPQATLAETNMAAIEIGELKRKMKRGSLLGNEEIHLGGDSPIFEIIYSNLEQRSIFS